MCRVLIGPSRDFDGFILGIPFIKYFQPIFDLSDNTIRMFESLMVSSAIDRNNLPNATIFNQEEQSVSMAAATPVAPSASAEVYDKPMSAR